MSEQVDIAAVGRDGRSLDEWIVVLEGKPERTGDSFDFCLVRDVLRRLREWRPSCVYHPRRYAIQLHIAAAGPSEALRDAVAYHDQAVEAVGLASCSLARAEVLTVNEFETGRDEEPVASALPGAPGVQAGAGAHDGPSAPTAPGIRDGLISDVLYRTTRALLRVSTPAEITELLVGFVIGVGGSVSVGDGHRAVGMVTVPLGGGESEPLHAVAETMSVAGIIIERCLPALVDDAGRVRRQLRQASA